MARTKQTCRKSLYEIPLKPTPDLLFQPKATKSPSGLKRIKTTLEQQKVDERNRRRRENYKKKKDEERKRIMNSSSYPFLSKLIEVLDSESDSEYIPINEAKLKQTEAFFQEDDEHPDWLEEDFILIDKF
jgi:hypothetical protein